MFRALLPSCVPLLLLSVFLGLFVWPGFLWLAGLSLVIVVLGLLQENQAIGDGRASMFPRLPRDSD